MINVVGITYDNQIEKNLSIHDADLDLYKWFWVDFHEPSDDEIKHLAYTFRFHPLAIEDCIQVLQRPKLDYYDDHSFYVTHIVREQDNEIYKEEIDFFVGEKFIVTFHRMPAKEVEQVWDRLLEQKNTEKWDSFYVFYQILDKIVDNYFPLIYKIEDRLDKIEDNTQNKSMTVLMNELFDTRHMLLNLRHSVHPMRDLLYRMLNSHHLHGIRERREYFSDIYDHLLKLSEMVMSNREVTADIRDSYLSLNSHQTNNVMKVLTIITSIFAPLTFIAGIYGMNFENMPELTWKYGYFLSLGLMVVIGILMFLWFKSKGWFK
ncbi:magnesium/cobalt transporter CorA [Metabacillus halosaccharovorans]|uniref:magnesium/cobalt transporter CorA n=1 Tax=Metabacillus halosaccharovorans TaxID=930124 RepID=UPI001C1F9B72|nr:magnesium/cobalt transporter CorA [Metabacillus halosaccharovorans]MBU7595310.1 magnesium/cobalt transporter CorA [Metabacillus halosaccharovorans]